MEGEIDFKKIIQPFTKQINRQKSRVQPVFTERHKGLMERAQVGRRWEIFLLRTGKGTQSAGA